MNTSHRALLLFLSRMRKQKPKGLHPKVHWNNSYNIYFASKSCFYSGLIQNHWSQQPKAERSNILQSLTAQREHHTSVGYRPFSPRSGPCRHTADLAYGHPTKLEDLWPQNFLFVCTGGAATCCTSSVFLPTVRTVWMWTPPVCSIRLLFPNSIH